MSVKDIASQSSVIFKTWYTTRLLLKWQNFRGLSSCFSR